MALWLVGQLCYRLWLRSKCVFVSFVLRAAATRARSSGNRRQEHQRPRLNHTRTLTASGQTWFHHIHSHTHGPKVKLTPYPTVGEGSNYPAWSHRWEQRRIVTNNPLYLLAAITFLCYEYCLGCFSTRFNFFVSSRSLFTCYLIRVNVTLTSSEMDSQKTSYSLILTLLYFPSSHLSPWNNTLHLASTLSLLYLPFSEGRDLVSLHLSISCMWNSARPHFSA